MGRPAIPVRQDLRHGRDRAAELRRPVRARTCASGGPGIAKRCAKNRKSCVCRNLIGIQNPVWATR